MSDLIFMYDGIEQVSKRVVDKMKQGFELNRMERRMAEIAVECMFTSMQN